MMMVMVMMMMMMMLMLMLMLMLRCLREKRTLCRDVSPVLFLAALDMDNVKASQSPLEDLLFVYLGGGGQNS